MDLIKKIFHIKIKYTDETYSLPNYMRGRYTIRSAWFDQQKVFLLYPKTQLDTFSAIRKRIEKMRSIERIPVVLMLDRITARERQGMIEAGIPFVVSDKQCFLPFVGMLLTERCDAELEPKEKLIPSAQMLLFHYINNAEKDLFTSSAITTLGVSAMTITRAVRNLEQTGLIQVYKSGVQKVMTTDLTRKELYEKAKPYLLNPIKRTVYIPADTVDKSLLYSGESALSLVSMLNPPRIQCYAAVSDEQWKSDVSDLLINEQNQVALQIWKYDPKALAGENHVDVLSLAACYLDEEDERIEICIDEMLEEYWEQINV
ncbi:MAG: MarR family transcriptional regulator [Eubacteriales bacterium]|nr:MarR family transcriptional regulator [Eubacteriales bacterium]